MSTTKQLIADKYLSPFRVFAAQRPDLGNVKVVAGEYQEQQLSKVMQEGSLTADIVDTWQRRWGKGNTLCFCVDISHAKAVQQRFLDAGIRCGYQDCFTDQRERALIKKQFHDGVLQVVCNVDTLTVGVDWDCRCLILARPTRSEMKFVQIIGRALRTAPGKTEALILDHSDTHQRLGFVSDIHHEQLSNGKMDQSIKAKPRQKLPKECPTCTCMVSPGIPTCPNCGYVFPIRGVSEIVEEDGTLVEYTADGRKVGNPKAGRDYTMAEKVAFFGELKGYRIQNGKSEGWAAHVYKTKFGVWPNHPSIRDAAARVPGMAVKQYIRSRNIAYVKGLAKKGAVR
jgi:superfamily II DNA or RNA helicase